MRRGKKKKAAVANPLLEQVGELKTKLRDIDQKLDHLIKNLRRFNHGHCNFNDELG